MKIKLLAIIAVCALGGGCQADEIKLDAPIESVSLFKNGLAVVRRSAEITGPGTYRLEDVLSPVHGTFWVEGDVPVDMQASMREVDEPARGAVDFQNDLVGKDVTLHFKETSTPVLSGKVVELARPKGEEAWNRDYSAQQYGNNYYPNGGSGQFLLVESRDGRTYVDLSTIASLQVPSGDERIHVRRQVFLLTSKSSKKGTIHLNYLTKGMAWAPSYRMELLDDKNLSLEQLAVVKNELGDLKDTDISLITGFPNFDFAHVLSPLSLNQNWAQFFSQMNTNSAQLANALTNGALSQTQAAPSNAYMGGAGLDLSATPSGEGTDLHYQSIGKQTLAEGDSLLVSVAKNNTTYERVMEWVIPDTRNDEGQMVNEQSGEPQLADDVWESIQFKNPLSFPMTTGPLLVVDSGHAAGQKLSYWTSPGEEASIKINKALSIRTLAIEEEIANPNPPTVVKYGLLYRKVSVKGTLTVNNHRNQNVRLIIRREFSGDLDKADGTPLTKELDVASEDANHRNDLIWTVPLKAGEEIKLTYQYTVLVWQR